MTKKQRVAAAAPQMLRALKLIDEHCRPTNWNDISLSGPYVREQRASLKAWLALDEAIEKADGAA